MSRPLRTIAILIVMGLVAVVGLLVLAGRMRSGSPRAGKVQERQVVPALPDRAR